jgi:hypothetical protein
MRKCILLISIVILSLSNKIAAQEEPNWSYDLGVSFFKSSLRNQPDELLYNPVFEKWVSINNQIESYSVTEYNSLDPFMLNLSVGVDVPFRYKRYFMIKVGYCYTNTLGIGGTGNITYIDNSSNLGISESKEMAYSSHQITYFIGPLIPLNDNGADIYMGFSMMSPTFISYREHYKRTELGIVVREYNKKFTGFFGNCRTVIGMQVPLSDKLKIGTEMVYAYFNGIQLKSDDIVDEGFRFPDMQWNFTFRYEIK